MPCRSSVGYNSRQGRGDIRWASGSGPGAGDTSRPRQQETNSPRTFLRRKDPEKPDKEGPPGSPCAGTQRRKRHKERYPFRAAPTRHCEGFSYAASFIFPTTKRRGRFCQTLRHSGTRRPLQVPWYDTWRLGPIVVCDNQQPTPPVQLLSQPLHRPPVDILFLL